MNTKKILSLFAVVLFISVLFSSCRSRDACPGVGAIYTPPVSNVG